MTIHLTVNGRPVALAEPVLLADYLRSLGVDPRAVAVEVDGRILSPQERHGHRLDGGQVVEIVRMVGGGR